MAAITSTHLVPVDEYIARFVDGGEKPTCEYIDGELIPKSMGSKKHGQLQSNLTKLIGYPHDETFNPLPEQTTRLHQGKFYVPDLAVEELAKPIPGRYPGPKDPVFLCVESFRHLIASAGSSASARNITSGAFRIAGSSIPNAKSPGNIFPPIWSREKSNKP